MYCTNHQKNLSFKCLSLFMCNQKPSTESFLEEKDKFSFQFKALYFEYPLNYIQTFKLMKSVADIKLLENYSIQN